jgi:hypothetical protein
MFRGRGFALVLALGALVAGGCGSSSSGGAKPGTAASTPAATTTATTAGREPPLPQLGNDAQTDISNANPVLAGEPILAKYHVKNGELGAFVSGNNKSQYRDVWTFYTQLLPQGERKGITVYAIFAPKGDSKDKAGYVTLNGDKSSWILAVNPDAPGGRWEQADTLVHETMHVLSIGGNQTDTSATHCSVDLGSAVGCPKPDSYLEAYIKRFWTPLLGKWEQAQKNKTLEAFYKEHASEFTRDYAATSPSEDIAESFAAYVLNTPNVPPGVVAKEKFFESYPALVAIKTYAQQHGAKGLKPPAS